MAGKQKNEFVQLGGILCAITLVVALALGAVNAVTVDKIAQINQQKIEDSLEAVMPGAESEAIEVAEGTTVTTETKNATPVEILSAYKMTKDGADAGYCVEVGPTGFGGAVDTKVVTVSHGEAWGHVVHLEHRSISALGKAHGILRIHLLVGAPSGIVRLEHLSNIGK